MLRENVHLEEHQVFLYTFLKTYFKKRIGDIKHYNNCRHLKTSLNKSFEIVETSTLETGVIKYSLKT